MRLSDRTKELAKIEKTKVANIFFRKQLVSIAFKTSFSTKINKKLEHASVEPLRDIIDESR